MSFNNQIFGSVASAPAIIYNSTNMSSDNISCTNLSGSIATFDELSVITFNPISFSADYADITNLSCDNLSVRLRSTMGSISTGNLSADEITLTGDLNASDVYAENILSTGDQLLLKDATVADRQTMIRRDNASTWVSLGNVFSSGGNISFDYGDMLFTTGPGTSSTPEFQIRKSTNGTFAYNSSVLNLSARVALLTETEVENILNMNDGSTLTLENTASLIGQANSTISSTGEVSFNNLSLSGALTCVSNISTPTLYVEDVFFMDPTRTTITSSLVQTTNDALYQLGTQNYKIRGLTGAGVEYMTCDSTLGNTNISNLSVDNLSTDLLNNISAGENITLSTEAGTNKLVITSVGGLNSSNLSLDNLSTVATSVQALEYRNNPAGRKSYVEVNTGSVKQYHQSSWVFQKTDASGIVFMKIDYAAENINISNLSVANLSLTNSNVSNMSVDNLSTNLLNNISAGENITLSTEAGTNKLVITSVGGLNSSNLSLDNLSVAENMNVSNLSIAGETDMKGKLVVGDIEFRNIGSTAVVSYLQTNMPSMKWFLNKTMDFRKDDDAGIVFMKLDHLVGNVNISNLSCANLSTDNVSSTELSLTTLRLKDNTQTTKASWFVYPGAMEIYTLNDFRIRNQGFAGSPNFIVMDSASNNVNISNLSVSHLDAEFVDLTNNLSDGSGINITSSGGKAVISLQDPVNISTITTENMNVSGSAANFFDGANIYGTATVTNLVSDLTNTLSAGSNITITSVGGKAQISSTGGGGSVPANLSIDNLSVNFDTTIGGDLKMLSADIIATSSELFIQDVTCTRNMSVANAFGANSISASASLTVGTNATVTGNITASVGDITATTGTVFAPNVSGTKVTGNNLSVFNDASITRDLKVQRYLDAGKPTFIMLRRTNNTALTSGSLYAAFNSNTSGQINGEFATAGGTTVGVTTGGWYRVSWALGYLRTSNTGGDRAQIRSYVEMNGVYNSAKNTISSSCYIRKNNLCREGHITGYNFLYIPAGQSVRLRQQCMVEGSTSWNSNLSGLQLRGSSNFMVEFVSSAAET